MKRVLFVYSGMSIGGSTTSLLGILENIDFRCLEVDLLLFNTSGPLVESIPDGVNILDQSGFLTRGNWRGRIRRGLSPGYLRAWIRASLISRRLANPVVKAQILGHEITRFFPRVDRDYDVAIAFLEFAPVDYVSRYVRATRKLAWLHIDYMGAGLLAGIEAAAFAEFDNIVVVSPSCLESFNHLYPGLESRTVCIENIVSTESVRGRAVADDTDSTLANLEGFEHCSLKIVSVSRVVFAHKGLDRAAYALRRVLDETPLRDFHWWIVGDGPDLARLERLVRDLDLGGLVTLCGSMSNPFPLMKRMDLFFIPSVYEGKPMAVTEAQVLGLPVLATEYASAREQIRDGVDGIIVENSELGIFSGLELILRDGELAEQLKRNVVQKDFGNREVLASVACLLEGGVLT